MKKLSSAIDRFCLKYPRFGIPRLMLYYVFVCAAVYLIYMMDRTGTFLSYLYFSPSLILKGQVWRLITYIFIPTSSSVFFFALSLYFYYWIGNTLQRLWGCGKFTIFYFSGIILTSIYGLIAGQSINAVYIDLSAYYLNLSMFFSFAFLFPETRVLLFFIIPIKIKWLAILDAVYFIIEIARIPMPMKFLPLVAILNFVIYCGPELFASFKFNHFSGTATSAQFQNKVRASERIEKDKAYRFKCSVCGRTDTDFPDLQFRYCSKCGGYHIFCEDHINSHVHFTE